MSTLTFFGAISFTVASSSRITRESATLRGAIAAFRSVASAYSA
jgi:hypothetical protein